MSPYSSTCTTTDILALAKRHALSRDPYFKVHEPAQQHLQDTDSIAFAEKQNLKFRSRQIDDL